MNALTSHGISTHVHSTIVGSIFQFRETKADEMRFEMECQRSRMRTLWVFGLFLNNAVEVEMNCLKEEFQG